MQFTIHYAKLENGQYIEDDMPTDTLWNNRMYLKHNENLLKDGYQHVTGFYNLTYFQGLLIAACLAKYTKHGWLLEIITSKV